MRQQAKVLILTAGYGEGHNQVARTLQQQLSARSGVQVEVLDLIKHAYPLIHSITSRMYLRSPQAARYGFDYYGWGYQATRDSGSDALWKKYFDEIGKKELVRMIRRFRPDVIINTFPFGAASVVGARLGIPVYTIVTDYVLHAGWVHADTTHYFVATEWLRQDLMTRGTGANQITISGIPVKDVFEQPLRAAHNAYRAMFRKGKEVVLLVAGSYGVLGQMDQLVRSIASYRDCEVAVVCGKNVKLERKLKSTFAGQLNVHIFGFVDQMHQLMELSTCIITKAGGITLTEAAARRLPLMIYRPFAGQEHGNANYFAAKGAAWIAHEPDELERLLLRMLSGRENLQRMKHRLAELHTPDSATRIADAIVKDLAHSNRRQRRSSDAYAGYVTNTYPNMLHV